MGIVVTIFGFYYSASLVIKLKNVIGSILGELVKEENTVNDLILTQESKQ